MSTVSEARSIAQRRIDARVAMLKSGDKYAATVTDRQKQAILALIEHGATVAEIETLDGMPSAVTIWRETKRDKAFGQALDDARIAAAANILDEAQHELRRALETQDPDLMRVAADYARGCTAYAEKIAPKQYGTLVRHAGADGGALTVALIDYTAAYKGALVETKDGQSREESEAAAREAIEALD